MARRQLKGARILVTGASSGIGRALCVRLCQHGASVLATARREDRLQRLQTDCASLPGTLQIIAGDLTLDAHREGILQWVASQWGGLDVLVNNAGVGAIGRFDAAKQDRLRHVMEVDFFAPVELTRHCLPWLRKGNRPAILNVGLSLIHI